MSEAKYVGVHAEEQGGMTHIAKIFRDAWVFGLIPKTEDGQGWSPSQVQNLYEQVFAAWEPFGHLPSRLSPELRQSFDEISRQAITEARSKGWNPELGDDD